MSIPPISSPPPAGENPQAEGAKHIELSNLINELETKIQKRFESRSFSMASILNTAYKISLLQREIPNLTEKEKKSLNRSKKQIELIINTPTKGKNSSAKLHTKKGTAEKSSRMFERFGGISSSFSNLLENREFKPSSKRAKEILPNLETEQSAKAVSFGESTFQEYEETPNLSEVPKEATPDKSSIKTPLSAEEKSFIQEKHSTIREIAKQVQNECEAIIKTTPRELTDFSYLIESLDAFSEEIQDFSYLSLGALSKGFQSVKDSMRQAPILPGSANKHFISDIAVSLGVRVSSFKKFKKGEISDKTSDKYREGEAYAKQMKELSEIKQQLTTLYTLARNVKETEDSQERIIYTLQDTDILLAQTIYSAMEDCVK